MLNDILDRLEKVKSLGHGKYTACCPVHGDKNPSMSVKEVEDGKVLCYCFACGARGPEVAEALNLPVSVLFPKDSEYNQVQYRRERLEQEKASDELFLRLYHKAQEEGKYIQLSDKKRYKQAINRLESIENMLANM